MTIPPKSPYFQGMSMSHFHFFLAIHFFPSSVAFCAQGFYSEKVFNEIGLLCLLYLLYLDNLMLGITVEGV